MEAPVRRSDVVLALLAYVPLLFLVPLMARRRSRFLVYHARQGLYLFSVFFVLFVVFATLFHFLVQKKAFDPAFVVQTLAVLIVMTLLGYVLAVVVMLWTVAQKKMVMLPVLGDLAGEQ